ncbi:purine nucleoside phosphorylase DeoD-type [Nanoarchaeota archaeon]
MYKRLLSSPEVLLEEFGVEKLTERVIISPIEWVEALPDNWIERLKNEGYKIEEILKGDRIMRRIDKNYKINNTLFLITGRGLTESLDRFYILCNNPDVKEIIFLGIAASFHEDLTVGDINIPEYVLPWEFISTEYVDNNEALPIADKELLDRVTNIANEVTSKDIKIRNYNHVTVGLFYSETDELIEYFRKFNLATIDMELSALYRLAYYYKKKTVGILRISEDLLKKQKVWETRKHERKDLGREIIYNIVKKLII